MFWLIIHSLPYLLHPHPPVTGRGRLFWGEWRTGTGLGTAHLVSACGMREGRKVGEVASPPQTPPPALPVGEASPTMPVVEVVMLVSTTLILVELAEELRLWVCVWVAVVVVVVDPLASRGDEFWRSEGKCVGDL